MKKLLILVLLSFFSASGLRAQLGAQLSYVVPQGILSHVVKPTVGVEFNGLAYNEMDDQLNLFVGAGIYYYRPTTDTFRVLSKSDEDTGPKLVAEEMVIRHFIVVPLSLSLEYKFLEGPLSPMAGVEANLFLGEVNAVIHSQHVNFAGPQAYIYVGATPKAGVVYQLNDEWQLTAGMARSIGLFGVFYSQVYNKPFVRCIHSF